MAGKKGDRVRIGQVVANNVFRKRVARPLTFIEVAVAYVKRESPKKLGTGDGASICSCVYEKIRLIRLKLRCLISPKLVFSKIFRWPHYFFLHKHKKQSKQSDEIALDNFKFY